MSDHVFAITPGPFRPWHVECSCGQLVIDAFDSDLASLLRAHLDDEQTAQRDGSACAKSSESLGSADVKAWFVSAEVNWKDLAGQVGFIIHDEPTARFLADVLETTGAARYVTVVEKESIPGSDTWFDPEAG